jgi:tetratricopeptide (TPR) repeat protein
MSRFSRLELDGEDQSRSTPADVLAGDEGRQLEHARREEDRARFEPALRLYARALEANPRSHAAWLGQVRMLLELGQFEDASAWGSKGVDVLPHSCELLAAKAVALAGLGQWETALAFSDEAVSIGGGFAYPWLARADVLLARGETCVDYCIDRALAAEPRDWRVPSRAARIHARHRQFARALALLRQAIALDATVPILWLQRGQCEAALGCTETARASLQQALALDALCEEARKALKRLGTSGFAQRMAGLWRRAFGR